MAPPLRASLELDLQDKLSAGLEKLEKQLDRLRSLAKQLGLGELEDALERLRGDSVDALEDGLRGVERQADAAARAIRRMANANDNAIRVNTAGVAQLNRSLGQLVVVPGGGGGRGGGGQDAPFVGGAPLLLQGPGGDNRIPLNLGRSVPALRNLYGAGRGVFQAGQNFGNSASGAISSAAGAALEGFAVYEPIKAYAERDSKLRQIAIMEGKSGAALDAEIDRLNALFNSDALQTGNTSASIAEAYHDLLGQGLDRKLVEGVLHAHSEAATAYGISPASLGNVTGSLVGNLGITGERDAESALAAVAYASQHGRVKIEDLSRSLPAVTGTAASLGMKGRGGLNTILAGEELAAKLASDGTQAGYNFNDMLQYITSNREDNVTRKRAGIDLPSLLLNGEKQGKSAFDVYVDFFKKNTVGKTPIQQSQFISSLVGNQQARAGLLAIIQHNDEFERLRKELSAIDELKLKIDLASVIGSPEIQLGNTNEALHQIGLTLGKGFLPVLTQVNYGLLWFNEFLTRMQKEHPKTTAAVLGTIAALLAIGAALTVVGVVAPVLTAGFELVLAVLSAFGAVLGVILSPIGLVIAGVAALGGAAYEIYKHWGNTGHFFDDLWKAVKSTFETFVAWVDTWTGGLGSRILKGIKSGWSALVDGFGELIAKLESKFTGGAIGRFLHLADTPQISGAPSAAGAGAAAGAAAISTRQDSLTIGVQAAPGTAVTSVQSTNPNHTIKAPNPGHTLNRP